MILQTALVLHLLGGVPAQVPDKYRDEYKEGQASKKNPEKVAKQEIAEILPNGKPPKTCSEECDVIERVMKMQCEKMTKKKPTNAKGCKNREDDMVKSCRDSCAAKGKIDKEYMKQHMKKPQAPPGRSGPRPSQFGNSEE